MNRRLWFTLGMLLAIALAYLLKDLVGAYVISPLVFSYRLLELLVSAAPQALWWSLIILLLGLIAIRSFARIHRIRPKRTARLKNVQLSRARTWSRWFRMAPKGDYSRWILARQLSELALEQVAYRERLSPQDARQFLQRRGADLPEAILEYLQTGWDVPSFRHYTDLMDRWRFSQRSSPLDLDPDIVVDYLESQWKTGGSS